MKQIVTGILAHVDAGKTTLSEAMLYLSGTIRTHGRVDHRNSFLDTNEIEREKGITIFSKQALLTVGDTRLLYSCNQRYGRSGKPHKNPVEVIGKIQCANICFYK